MRKRSHGIFGGLVALILAIVPILGSAGLTSAATPGIRAWQFDGNSYVSPQFDYVIEWDDAWAARERDAVSDRGGADEMTLSNNDGLVRVTGQSDDISADEALDGAIEDVGGVTEPEIVVDDRDADVPSVELTAGRQRYLMEAHEVEGAVVVISLRARDTDFDVALSAAEEGITINGTGIFSGEPAGPNPAPAVEPTEQPTEEPTEEPAVKPTEEPTEEPTEQANTSGIDGNSYTSPDHGFSLSWDDEWDAIAAIGADGYNELRLTSSTGSLTIQAGSFYDGDPDTCLQGESDYFGNDDPKIKEWAPALDADGNVITHSADRVAYGVFTLQYGSEDTGFVDLVDYIECRSLVPGETTLEILASTTPDQYEAHIAAVLDITNAIEMPEGQDAVEPADPALPALDDQPAAQPSASPEATAVAEENTNDNSAPGGEVFESQSFGFTVAVPNGWTVEDSSSSDGEDLLVVNNGVSTISIQATNAYTGDLEGCISFAHDRLTEDPAYADIRLESTVNGQPYRGSDDRKAYALFSYTGADGEKRAHYVNCEPIVEGESVLIVSQDVAFDDFQSERSARREIERAIEFP